MKFLPLATDWGTICHLRGQKIIGPFEHRDPKPPHLLFVISAIGDITVEGCLPVAYGAIACGHGEFKSRRALEVLALEAKSDSPLLVREWLIEQAWKAGQAMGYYIMFRSGKNTLLKGGNPDTALPEGLRNPQLQETIIDV